MWSGSRIGSGRWRALALVSAIAAATGGAQAAEKDDALAILKAMSDYVGSQKAIHATFDSDIEVITPQLEKLQFANSGEAWVSRPDKLRAHRIGGYADVEMVFDGKTLAVVDKADNRFARIAAPGSVDQLIDTLHNRAGAGLPASDLLLTDSYSVLSADVLESRHIGRGIVGGVECEHLAFRNFDTDWQIWIEAGEHPVPRKLVITSKTVNNAPQYTVTIKSFDTSPKIADDAFAFVPAKGAQEISADALVSLDELPPSADSAEGK